MNLSTLCIIAHVIVTLVHITIFGTPLFSFLLIYGELVILLNLWISGIITDISKSHMSDNILEQSKMVIEALKKSSKLFSYNLFWILTLLLCGLIFSTYRSLSFLLGNYAKNWEYICMSGSFLMISIAYCCIIWYLCHLSQTLISKTQDLKVALGTNLSLRRSVLDESSELEIICSELNDFKGFHGEDFFNVNNSLITGMVSNFVTYLIILIEFKITENNK